MMTRAPAAASASAVARPMPRDAPVTRAVLLARLAMMAFSMRWFRRCVGARKNSSGTRIASVRGHAAVDVEDFAGDPLGSVRTDEDDAVGDFLGEAETIERNLLVQGGLVLCRAGEAGQHAGVRGSGRHGIHTNPRLGEFEGHRLSDAFHCMLGADIDRGI